MVLKCDPGWGAGELTLNQVALLILCGHTKKDEFHFVRRKVCRGSPARVKCCRTEGKLRALAHVDNGALSQRAVAE